MLRYNLSAFLLFALLLLSGCPTEGYDCGDHGEYIEGGCVCENGWAGTTCEYNLATYLLGNYLLDTAYIDSNGVDLGFDSLEITSNLVGPMILELHTPKLNQPMSVLIDSWNQKVGDILNVPSMLYDSAGFEVPIFLAGSLRLRAENEILLDLRSHGMRCRFVRI